MDLSQRMRRVFRYVCDAVILVVLAAAIWKTFAPPDRAVTPLLRLGATLGAVPASEALRSIVLVFDTSCEFCVQSADLYRRLAAEIESRDVERFVVMTPRPEETASWLAANGILSASIVGVRDLQKAGIRATPTLIVIDQDRVVTDLLIGKLQPEQERALFARIGDPGAEALDNSSLAREYTASSMPPEGEVVFLDIRERPEFESDHREGAINIPSAELAVRGPIELDVEEDIMIDCRMSVVQCRNAGGFLLRAGFADVSILIPE